MACVLSTVRRWIPVLVALALALALVVWAVVSFVADAPSPASAALGALGAAGFFWLLQRMNVERLIEGLELAGSALPLCAYLVVASTMGETRGSLAFAEVGAQVIVVLLLVLAIDARFFRLRTDRDRLDLSATIFTLLVLAVGEYYALHSVIMRRPRHSEMVAGAIAAGFAALMVTALLGSARSAGESIDSD
jgi:hypothetical protein